MAFPGFREVQEVGQERGRRWELGELYALKRNDKTLESYISNRFAKTDFSFFMTSPARIAYRTYRMGCQRKHLLALRWWVFRDQFDETRSRFHLSFVSLSDRTDHRLFWLADTFEFGFLSLDPCRQSTLGSICSASGTSSRITSGFKGNQESKSRRQKSSSRSQESWNCNAIQSW